MALPLRWMAWTVKTVASMGDPPTYEIHAAAPHSRPPASRRPCGGRALARELRLHRRRRDDDGVRGALRRRRPGRILHDRDQDAPAWPRHALLPWGADFPERGGLARA